MKNFKKEYVFGILLVLITVISLLFFRDNIIGYFTYSNARAGLDKQIYDAYTVLVDGYTPTWNENDCYNLFGLDESPFDHEANQLDQSNVKIRVLEKNTSRDYTSSSGFKLYYFYDKFSVCSFNHVFIINNFTPVLFEQIRSDVQQEIDYKKIADFNCNNGNISVIMWEQPNGALTMLSSYVIFSEEEVPGGFIAEQSFGINTNMNKIAKSTLLLNGDKFAYFNYTIATFIEDYCNPNLPTKITFTE